MEDIAKFIFEAGVLKRMARAGWAKEGIRDAESIAEHSHRTVLIGYLLAKMEGADAGRVMEMCAFHDVAEVRIGDLDSMMKRYHNKAEAESAALHDQIAKLPMKDEIAAFSEEFEKQGTHEAIVARDADLLEMMFQAKEYAESGYKGCLSWIEHAAPRLRTESAKKLLAAMRTTPSTDWKS